MQGTAGLRAAIFRMSAKNLRGVGGRYLFLVPARIEYFIFKIGNYAMLRIFYRCAICMLCRLEKY